MCGLQDIIVTFYFSTIRNATRKYKRLTAQTIYMHVYRQFES